ncbi:hypothetical protein G6F57_011821 [Rhizopus arrhizus]|nr:hypothetical protein G6F30_011600 [Rhizopus arrhizus]KAG1408218.1 hypothetical protein G6F58_009527 [Rhizopus delemar]KAG0975048.1 hypothetical protein G6F29_011808 [Rhizopus arrhizus]KAG0980629.1 hypothetical protein G6F28_011609 [Rhizopus arrhizus]KAG1002720.1 hypothetical protein G6F27_011702 [Rhizopus arrhizus]
MIETEYSHLVTETKYQSITNAPYKHRIDTGDALPVAKRDYRRSHKENMEIQQEVDKMLAAKVIIPSNSNWCSPVVLAPKPDGTKRFCVDYRGLNKVTIKDKYPIPRISELLDSLHGSKYFSCIDLKSGYWQLPMDPQDAKKTAFIANGSLYEFTCLPFGVVNGPSSFMRFMHGVLRGVKNTMVYLDDVIIYSKTKEQHVQDLRNVLTKLDQYNLKISLKKCQFFQQEVKFLGFLQIYQQWPSPYTTYCKKQEKFIWNDKAQAAFEALKQRMVELPTLAYPDTEAPYDLHSDASDYGLGAVLVQRSRPIAYASRTLQPAELNYSTTEKECLAVVWALNYFYPYLYGADFTIYTDHAALRSILATKMPRGRIARWILTIQAYRFTVIHKKGSLNADADALSRLYEKQNQQDIAQLSMEEFKRHQEDDKIIQVLKGEKKDCYVITNGLLCYKKKDDKLVPILPQMMVETVISKYHDGITGGHFGIDKTVDKIKEVAWWPNMVEDVKEYIRTCPACQIYKVRNDSIVAPMKPILPRYTGDIWAADIAELLKSNNGNTYMLVLVEYLSKWAITVALPSFSTDHVAQVLLYDVVLKFGVPSRLITDNGSNFVSEAMAMVCSRLGIKRALTSVEHPQTDGLVERMNRTIKISLAAYVGKDNKLDWDTYLPFVTFAYNTATQASTGFSPFEILFGRKAVLPLNEELIIDPKTYETESWINYLNTYLPLVHGEAIENLKKAQERQKKFYDDRRTIKHDYKSGDLIVRRNLLKTSFPKERWTGPWMVLRKNNEDGTSYVIQKPGDSNNHTTTANVKHMRPWFSRNDQSNEQVLLGGDNVIDQSGSAHARKRHWQNDELAKDSTLKKPPLSQIKHI